MLVIFESIEELYDVGMIALSEDITFSSGILDLLLLDQVFLLKHLNGVLFARSIFAQNHLR